MDLKCRQTDSELECFFPADTSCVENLLEKVKELLAGKCDQKTYFNISLVLRESLNNAIFHGAGADKSLGVGCKTYLTGDKAVFEVSSPGPGFNWKDYIDRNPVGRAAESGWGLFLINSYSDGFEFNESGSVLRFWISLSEKG